MGDRSRTPRADIRTAGQSGQPGGARATGEPAASPLATARVIGLEPLLKTPLERAVERWMSIPGVDRRVAFGVAGRDRGEDGAVPDGAPPGQFGPGCVRDAMKARASAKAARRARAVPGSSGCSTRRLGRPSHTKGNLSGGPVSPSGGSAGQEAGDSPPWVTRSWLSPGICRNVG